MLQKLIDAALRGFFLWYQCFLLHCQVTYSWSTTLHSSFMYRK